MIKIPYIISYSLFEKIDLAQAEDLLNEYNDFKVFNKTQINNAVKTVFEFTQEAPEETNEQTSSNEHLSRVEHNQQVASDHFEKIFGSKDFAESALVGLKIDYDAIQRVLFDETARKIPITESSLNKTIPMIRTLASTLLFAERIISSLRKFCQDDQKREKCELAIDFAKEGFELMLDGIEKGNLAIPEYHNSKKELNKIKTVDGFVEFCERLFFENR